MKQDHAGIRFPPPFGFVIPVALGAWLSTRWPWHIGGGSPGLIASYLLVGFALALIGVCFAQFWSRGTSVVPVKPASTLVVAGPYRLSRNPMYLALVLLTIAAALWLDTWWILLLLLPAIVAIDLFVIRKEEAYLRRRFGADYDAYTRHVRRWV